MTKEQAQELCHALDLASDAKALLLILSSKEWDGTVAHQSAINVYKELSNDARQLFTEYTGHEVES